MKSSWVGAIAAFPAIAADNTGPLGINTEDQTSAGVAPPGLPPPPTDPRDLEGSWYPFQAPRQAGPNGPPPGNAGGRLAVGVIGVAKP